MSKRTYRVVETTGCYGHPLFDVQVSINGGPFEGRVICTTKASADEIAAFHQEFADEMAAEAVA